LKNPLVARRQQAFHVELGRRPQECAARRFGVDMQFQRRRRDPDGSLDFQESAFVKELADDTEEFGADTENGAQSLQTIG
jgi:hypothetical protein